MKNCSTCKNLKPLDEFGNNKGKPGGKQPYCKECGREKDRKHYQNSESRQAKIKKASKENKIKSLELIWKYLEDHPCVDCGETDPIVLEFDHVKGDKVIEISRMPGFSLAKIKEEIEKCVVRCANCHRRKTARERNHYGFLRLVARTSPS